MIYGSGGIGGVQGWRVLQRSSSSQTAQLAKDPVVVREQAAFAERLAATFGTPTAPSWAAASWPELLERAEAADPNALARGLLVSEREYGERFREAVELALEPDAAS